ncbi:MAG: hypothetical protein F6K30_27835 [Cyanothece sp. SIO2G6]|nr:hypothetical protein [Cyanothece sp. SIO2G6]
MSELLINSLEYLISFFDDYFPDEERIFLPGLSREEVINAFQSIDLPCPDEIITLYSWRNGTSSGFKSFSNFPPEFCFMPLHEVIEIYENFYRNSDDLECLDTIYQDYDTMNTENCLENIGINENHRMIHFVNAGDQFYSVIVTAENSYVLLYTEEGGGQDLCFQSLTSMFQTISASYQEGAYIIREDKEIELEPELFKSIWERYNPLLAQGPSSAVVDEYIEAQVEAQNEDDELWA